MRSRSLGWTAAVGAMAGVLASARIVAAETGASAIVPVARRVVVSIPDRTLALIVNDEVVRVYAVSVGKPSTPSPVGTFTIVNRVANPTCYKPGLHPPAQSRRRARVRTASLWRCRGNPVVLSSRPWRITAARHSRS